MIRGVTGMTAVLFYLSLISIIGIIIVSIIIIGIAVYVQSRKLIWYRHSCQSSQWPKEEAFQIVTQRNQLRSH